jgi:hypothetical protein
MRNLYYGLVRKIEENYRFEIWSAMGEYKCKT